MEGDSTRVSAGVRWHPARPDGTEVDASFELHDWGAGWDLIALARGGKKGTPAARNTEYAEGLELVISRLAALEARIIDALLDSETVNRLPRDDRRLQLPLPIQLRPSLESRPLALTIGQALAKVARVPGAGSGGNPTRRLLLAIEIDDRPSTSELVGWLRGNAAVPAALPFDFVQWLERIRSTPRQRSGDAESKHQPATIRWFLERAVEADPRMVRWSEARGPLGLVLREAGGAPKPQYPLLALARSGVLDVDGLETSEISTTSVSVARLNTDDPQFGLPQAIEEELRVSMAARRSLENLLAGGLPSPNTDAGTDAPLRRRRTIEEIQRSALLRDLVKEMYDHTCQRCGLQLRAPSGKIADAAHIHAVALGGPDRLENLLCLCPNCHRLFDRGAWWAEADGVVVEPGRGKAGELRLVRGHYLDEAAVRANARRWVGPVGSESL